MKNSETDNMHQVAEKYWDYITQNYGTDFCALKDDDKNNIYLRTYFSRSFQESYTIFNNLFSNNLILSTLNKKDLIRILDIGTGTGGDIFGFIEVFERYFEGKDVRFYPIEGNKETKKIFMKIFFNFIKDRKNTYKLVKTPIKTITEYNSEQFVKYVKKHISAKLFDIILSFKFISENVVNLSYYDYMVSSNSLIIENGIVLIADTTNHSNGNYNSMILLRNLKEYKKNIYESRDNFRLLPILPRPCSRLDNKIDVKFRYKKGIYKFESRDVLCNSKNSMNCFLQHEFSFNNDNDKERLCWVLLCSGKLGEVLSAIYMKKDSNNKYIIGERGCEKNTCQLINDNIFDEKSALFF